MSCLLPVETIEGARVETIEGLTPVEGLHPIQEAFLDGFATQCGFCTPGMIMATVGLLAANPEPTREDAVRAISGNICRCTGYVAIIDAVLDAARRVREARRAGEGEGGVMERIDPGFFADERAADLSVVGTTVPRADARGHVTGRTQFHEDVSFPDTLHLVMVRSTRHHAKFTLDVAPALAVPGRGAGADPQGRAEQLVHDPAADRRRAERRAGAARGPGAVHGRADLRRARRDARRGAGGRAAGRGSTTRSCRRSSTSRRRSRRRRSRRTARTTSSTRATTAGASASATSSRASPRPTTSSSSATNPRRSSTRRSRPPAAPRSRRATGGSPSTPTPRRSTSPSTTWR